MPPIDKVENLFHEALACPPDTDRLDWLNAHCQHDRELYEEVVALLNARAELERDQPAAVREDPLIPDARFGVYRAVALLGIGGMSTVYRAERCDGEFEQTVALKIMAGYLAGKEFLRRFQAERQLLATLNHNNIARLLDGGTSSSGDPYLVTELVDGAPVDRYCEQRKLAVAARLRLFLQVCGAVDHAHRNTIVHRDLKPANILVNQEGTVKLLDFGTASLIKVENDQSVTRMRMLTPRYASPEQLRGGHVNTASDIFSLGVVLYELVTGAWPFGDPTSQIIELKRATDDIPPAPPATTITKEAAEYRSASRDSLRRMLAGDLSAVVLKAIENDPSRRYASVREFAADIESYLENRPVEARLQTVPYRLSKFLRRRWFSSATAAVFVFGLAAAAGIAVREAKLAREHYADLRALTTSLLFELKDAIKDVPGSTDAQGILVSRVVRNLDKMAQSSADPALKLDLAEAFRQLGELQGSPYVQNLNDPKGALGNLEKARAIAEGTPHESDDPTWLHFLMQVAEDTGEVHFGQGHTKDAVAQISDATAYAERLVTRTKNAAWLSDAATTFQVLGDVLGQPGTASLRDPVRAAKNYRRAMELDGQILALSPESFRVRRGIALIEMKQGALMLHADPEAALEHFQRAVSSINALPETERNRPVNKRFWAFFLVKEGAALTELQQFGEAVNVFQQAVAFFETEVAADPNDGRAKTDLIAALDQLQVIYDRQSSNEQALALTMRERPLMAQLLEKDPANHTIRLWLARQKYQREIMLGRLGRGSVDALRKVLAEIGELAASPGATFEDWDQAIDVFTHVEPASLREPQRALEFAQKVRASGQADEVYGLYLIASADHAAGDAPRARLAAEQGLALMAPPKGSRISRIRQDLEAIAASVPSPR